MTVYIEQLDNYISCEEIFDKLYNKDNTIFLDSSMKNTLGRYSIIGVNPYLKLKEIDGVLYINEEKSKYTFEEYLDSYLKENKEENNSELPIISGALGYFSYDYGRKFEKIKSKHHKKVNIPEAVINFYDNYIIEDTFSNSVYISANGKLNDKKVSINNIKEIINQNSIIKEEKYNKYIIDHKDIKVEYSNTIKKVKEYIQRGHIYVMNLTRQVHIRSDRKPYEVFKRLQKDNRAPFSAYMNMDRFEVISASPERFIRIRDRKIETRPIKGTRKRGKDALEDEKLKNELMNSEKDKSELLMIVDLERNDLNKICIPGSVNVNELFKVETYATVFHLIANVEGKLIENVSIMDVIKAVFPGGSITGAPKIRAMEIIDELEVERRGLYTGIIGYISLNEDCDFNIVIRTAIHENNEYHIGVGGGITYESEEEFEYDETVQKAKALVDAITK